MANLPFLPRGGPAKALALVSLSAVGAIWYSHYSQVRDRQVMRAGVERDKERLRAKRRQQKEEGVTVVDPQQPQQ